MFSIYIVAATGGLEDPTFRSVDTLPEALDQFTEWADDLIGNPGDRVDVIEVSDTGCAIVKSARYGDED